MKNKQQKCWNKEKEMLKARNKSYKKYGITKERKKERKNWKQKKKKKERTKLEGRNRLTNA